MLSANSCLCVPTKILKQGRVAWIWSVLQLLATCPGDSQAELVTSLWPPTVPPLHWIHCTTMANSGTCLPCWTLCRQDLQFTFGYPAPGTQQSTECVFSKYVERIFLKTSVFKYSQSSNSCSTTNRWSMTPATIEVTYIVKQGVLVRQASSEPGPRAAPSGGRNCALGPHLLWVEKVPGSLTAVFCLCAPWLFAFFLILFSACCTGLVLLSSRILALSPLFGQWWIKLLWRDLQ